MSAAALPVPGPRGGVHELRAGDYRAVICEVGACVNDLELAGRPLLVPSALDTHAEAYRGVIVAPWPNRLGDGVYTWDGEEHEVPLNEHERRNALHGLVSFQRFERADDGSDPARVALRHTLLPSVAYPFTLVLEVEHALDAERGLTTTVTARNAGTNDLPYGVCPHPYLVAGASPLDEWTLHVDAARILDVTPDRLLPLELRELADDDALAYRTPREIGAQEIDHAYTALARVEGRATITVEDPAHGTGAALEFDESCPWVQIHTADRPEKPSESRRGVAVEPMTCPPDAFRSGTDVIRLAPRAVSVASWSIRGW